MQKVKVCHITSAHARYDGRIFQKECISLNKNGYDVSLIVNDDIVNETVKGVKIYSVNRAYSGRIKRVLALKDFFRYALHIDADIYHLHDPELLLIAKKLKKKRKKVIFDSHECYYEQIKIKPYLPKLIRNIIAKIYYKYETNVLKNIDAVVGVKPKFVNNSVIDPFKSRCSNVTYVGNYPIKTERTGQWNKREDFCVCYAGGLTHERGITNLIEACYLAKCKLILVGPFSSEEYHEFLKQKEAYECVEYRGICEKDEVYDIYEEASLGAATLLNVGQYYKMNDFATKVVEYFQMKLPVLISNYPYAIEMNEKYNFGICVDPDNICEIVKAIKLIRNDKNLAELLGGNGYALYEKHFNWENEEKKLVGLYSDLITKN